MGYGPIPGKPNIWQEQLVHDAFYAEAKAKIRDGRHHEDALRPDVRGVKVEDGMVERIETKDLVIALIVLFGFIGLVIVILTML